MERVGRYEITARLGQGGMGTVYKAFDPMLARIVAVKVIAGHLDDQPDQRERFFREARAVAQLSHRNIVTIYDLGEEGGSPFLAMEYLEGQDLDQRLRGPERISLSRRLAIAIETCAGLAHAHAFGVVHRDIKPANIFLTNDGQVKLLDFGLARLATSELTRSNVMLGTVNYMAPEQLRGEKADHRADVFALGVLFYELFGGRKPFQGDSFASTMFKILEEAPEPLAVLNPELPPALVAAIEHAMAKPRDERYQQVVELLRDLEDIRDAGLIDSGDVRRLMRASDPDSRPSSGSSQTPPPPPEAMTMSGDEPTSFGAAPMSGASRHSGRRSRAGSSASALPPPGAPSVGPASGASSPTSSAVAPPEAERHIPRAWMAGAAAVLLAAVAGAAWTLNRSEPRAGETATVAVRPPETPAAPSPAQAPAPQGARTPEPRPAQPTDAPKDDAVGTLGGDALASEITRAMRAARSALAGGRYDAAARSVERALTLDPTSREARRIAAQVTAIQRKQADKALTALDAAKGAALRAGARELVPQLQATAERQEADARKAISSGRFDLAATQIEVATALYRSAESSARGEAEARAAREKAVEKSAPTVVASPPPVAAAPAPPPPSAPPAPEPPRAAPDPDAAAREAIRATLARYVSALEHRDLGALRAVWPGLGGAQLSAIQSEFDNARSIDAAIEDARMDLAGSAATVTAVRRYALQTRDGQQLRRDTGITLHVRRAGTSWVIEAIRFDAPR